MDETKGKESTCIEHNGATNNFGNFWCIMSNSIATGSGSCSNSIRGNTKIVVPAEVVVVAEVVLEGTQFTAPASAAQTTVSTPNK